MENLTNSGLILNIIEFLPFKDIHSVHLLNKSIYRGIDKKELIYVLKNRAKYTIYKSLRSYVNFLRNINEEEQMQRTQKELALYYYKYYPRDCINEYYNTDGYGRKSNIIRQCKNQNNLRDTDNPSRYDLYQLVKNLDVQDTYYIGW